MSFFTDDYQRFAGTRYDHIIKRVKNWIFHHNIRFLYWLRKAEAGSF